MNKLHRTCALVVLSLTVAISAYGGTIHSTGVVSEPPPPPPSETSTSTSMTTTVILTILTLIR
jgi:hypothetical protein